MDFWKFIETHAAAAPSIEAACGALEMALQELPEPEVLAYCQEFYAAMDKAYTWDLWGVAYLIQGGCSDDAFMDFRSCLVACGQDIFERAVADPEFLLSIPQSNLSALFEEGILYVGPAVYESISGQTPQRPVGPSDPLGAPWEETREDLMQRFPKAWALYGWEEPQAASMAQPPIIATPPNVTPPPSKPWWKFW